MHSHKDVLVVDDDEAIRDLVSDLLRQRAITVRTASDIAGARASLAAAPVAVVVLDLNLPDGDGLSFCKELRQDRFAGRIIMLTARGDAIDRVLGLEIGADDYLSKPFEPRELVARVRNLLAREPELGEVERPPHRFAKFGQWRLDLHQRRIIAPDGRLVMLSSAEFRLLRRFVDSPNVVRSREDLLPERRTTVAFDRSIDLQISRLRQKLAIDGIQDDVILTIRNEGYVMATPVTFE